MCMHCGIGMHKNRNGRWVVGRRFFVDATARLSLDSRRNLPLDGSGPGAFAPGPSPRSKCNPRNGSSGNVAVRPVDGQVICAGILSRLLTAKYRPPSAAAMNGSTGQKSSQKCVGVLRAMKNEIVATQGSRVRKTKVDRVCITSPSRAIQQNVKRELLASLAQLGPMKSCSAKAASRLAARTRIRGTESRNNHWDDMVAGFTPFPAGMAGAVPNPGHFYDSAGNRLQTLPVF